MTLTPGTRIGPYEIGPQIGVGGMGEVCRATNAQAFPGPGPRYQVCRDGGTEPTWSRSGKEIFFRSGDEMMAATLTGAGDTLELSTPTLLFEGRFVTATNPSGDTWYDVSADGQRFLMLRADDTRHIITMQNWSEELKARVPPQ